MHADTLESTAEPGSTDQGEVTGGNYLKKHNILPLTLPFKHNYSYP